MAHAVAGRLQHKLHRLLYRHEETLDVGMGDRQRAALLELTAEQRHDGAARSEHVAEPDGHEARPRHVTFVGLCGCREVQGLGIEFGQPLARPHDAGGVDGLVRRDLHHGQSPMAQGRVGDVAGPEHVGERPLDGVELDHGHVLQRRRMKDEVGPMLREHMLDAHPIADVGRDFPRAIGVELGTGEVQGQDRQCHCQFPGVFAMLPQVIGFD